MTPVEAEQRITLSRRTLFMFLAMQAAGEGPSSDNLALITDEISVLESVGERHPGHVGKLVKLVSEWVAFRNGLKARLH